MISTREDALATGRMAVARHAWNEALVNLQAADEAGELDAEDLEALGRVAWWCCLRQTAIDAFERAYRAFVTDGRKTSAAKVALMLHHNYSNGLQDKAGAKGWLKRAERLLEYEPRCAEHGYLARVQGRRAWLRQDIPGARRLLELAIEIGIAMGDANLVAMSQSWLGIGLVDAGQREEGCALVEAACAPAVVGELGPFATGVIFCNAISAYRAAGDFGPARDWTDAAEQWCETQSITGFPGICRVHRAEFMRLRGAWAHAEHEANLACQELDGFLPGTAGSALYEVGQIRLRRGDLAGAEDAFKQSHQLGRNPQPGLSLVHLARGDAVSALALLSTALTDFNFAGLDRANVLAAQVEAAIACARPAIASAGCNELDRIAVAFGTTALRALAATARGLLMVAEQRPEAIGVLRQASHTWQEIEAPNELSRTRLLLAEAHRQAGDVEGARLELEAAISDFQSLGAEADWLHARQLLERLNLPQVPDRRTFMFTDIAGSTKLLEAIGDEAWANLLAWLESTLRDLFGGFHGEEVDHAGDGFFVAFPNTTAAMDCAVAIQRSLADHRRRHGFAPRIRIGVHATSATRVGVAYRGRGVHEASRIASLAGADQILVSAESVPDGAQVSEPMKIAVKGLSTPLEGVAVQWI